MNQAASAWLARADVARENRMGKGLAVALVALGASLLSACAPHPYDPYQVAPAYISSGGVPVYTTPYPPAAPGIWVPPSVDFSPGGDHQDRRHRRSRR
jgi:hypothetical protein